MSCVFLSKSILRCLPHSFLNKLADEFQSKCGSVRRPQPGRGERGPFKARRVWIMLKMGQEEEEAKKRGGGWVRSSSIKPPPHPCLFCLSFLRRKTDAVAQRGQSILRAITNRPLTIRWDKKWVQLKNKSMRAILTARKNTPILSSFFFPLER